MSVYEIAIIIAIRIGHNHIRQMLTTISEEVTVHAGSQRVNNRENSDQNDVKLKQVCASVN